MYLDYWGLHSPPFMNIPNGNVFFQSPQHMEALHRLLYIVKQRKGVVMISGEVGCGKTTLVRALENYLSKNNYFFVNIPNPALDPVDFIRAILLKLGDNAEGTSKTFLLNRLQQLLEASAEQEIETILVIDESHIYKLCQDCIDKFMKWQGKKFSNLFPTNLMKKRLKEKEK